MKTLVCAVAVAVCLAGTAQADLLTNWDFSSGLTGWWGGESGFASADTQSPDGHNALLISQTLSVVEFGQHLSLDVSEGDQFDLSFMAASPDQTATHLLAVRAWWNGPGGTYGLLEPTGGLVVSAEELNSGWATYNANFVMTAGHPDAWLADIAFSIPACTGEHYALDNVHLVEHTVPEPGALLLLSIGLIGLLAYAWHRRK